MSDPRNEPYSTTRYVAICRTALEGYAWRCYQAVHAFPAAPSRVHTERWSRGLEEELVSCHHTSARLSSYVGQKYVRRWLGDLNLALAATNCPAEMYLPDPLRQLLAASDFDHALRIDFSRVDIVGIPEPELPEIIGYYMQDLAWWTWEKSDTALMNEYEGDVSDVINLARPVWFRDPGRQHVSHFHILQRMPT